MPFTLTIESSAHAMGKAVYSLRCGLMTVIAFLGFEHGSLKKLSLSQSLLCNIWERICIFIYFLPSAGFELWPGFCCAVDRSRTQGLIFQCAYDLICIDRDASSRVVASPMPHCYRSLSPSVYYSDECLMKFEAILLRLSVSYRHAMSRTKLPPCWLFVIVRSLRYTWAPDPGFWVHAVENIAYTV